jgi:hypothetical protein
MFNCQFIPGADLTSALTVIPAGIARIQKPRMEALLTSLCPRFQQSLPERRRVFTGQQ